MQNSNAQIKPWNILDHLQSEEDILTYLHAAEEDGDPALIEAVKADIALARETHSLFTPDQSS
jgi:DNA-binding phage protein